MNGWFMVDLSVPKQFGERTVLPRYIGFEARGLAEFVTRLAELAEAIESERLVHANAGVVGVELARAAVGVERALEVAAAEVHVAAVVESGGVARIEFKHGVELTGRDVHDAGTRGQDADLHAGFDVL